MNDSNVFNQLFSGKRVFVSHSIGVLVKLAVEAVKRYVKLGAKPTIVDETGFLLRYIPLELLDRVVVSTNIAEACSEDTAILFEPTYMKRLELCAAPNVLVFSKPKSYYPSRYLRVYITRASTTGHYIARCPLEGLVMRFTISDEGIAIVEGPPGVYGKAYETLKRAMSDYGELNVKDAVRVLVVELGVEKTRARQILLWLARNSYVKVVKGKLSLV